MPLLDMKGNIINDDWRDIIVPFEAITRDTKAIMIVGNSELPDIKNHMAQLEIIVVDFPKFADGRGFSQAHWLKRHGFTGQLRAKGWLLPDQLRHLIQCGFTSIDLDDVAYQRHGAESWQAPTLVRPSYQRSYAGDFPQPNRK